MNKNIAKRPETNSERKLYYRDQLVTREDLEEFKKELLEEIKQFLQPMQSAAPKKWLKGSEVRKLLNLSGGKLQTLRITGKLSSTKVGSVHYYKYEDIVKMMENK
ncbi:MAG TPA: DNA-binding protein [Puia sp.]